MWNVCDESIQRIHENLLSGEHPFVQIPELEHEQSNLIPNGEERIDELLGEQRIEEKGIWPRLPIVVPVMERGG